MPDINSPVDNDNRNYDYSLVPTEYRKEYEIIISLIPEKVKVLDLGCGNGSLMALLRQKLNVSATGVEISKSGIEISRSKGFEVFDARIDEPLPFKAKSFDFAICNVTIQMVMYPEVLLKEMKRVAKYQIISFPNFAFWRNRVDMFFNGRMPKPGMFGYKWYSTGHIHQLSINDFKELVNDVGGLTIEQHICRDTENPLKKLLHNLFPNIFQVLPVFLLKAK